MSIVNVGDVVRLILGDVVVLSFELLQLSAHPCLAARDVTDLLMQNREELRVQCWVSSNRHHLIHQEVEFLVETSEPELHSCHQVIDTILCLGNVGFIGEFSQILVACPAVELRHKLSKVRQSTTVAAFKTRIQCS